MVGKSVYKRTNIDDVLTLNYTNGDISLKYIIDADMYGKLPLLTCPITDKYVISRYTSKLVKCILNNTDSLRDSFIKYRNGNNFDLRRTNIEIIRKNKYYTDPNNPDITLLYIQSSNAMHEPHIVKFDTQFITEVSQYLWRITVKQYAKSSHSTYTDGVFLHRLIFELSNDNVSTTLMIDHIDRDTFNNCSINLREATFSENNRNRKIKRKSKSGINGVYKYRNCWVATVPGAHKKNVQYYFSVLEHGEEIAKQLAIEKRKEWEIKLGITSVLVDQ